MFWSITIYRILLSSMNCQRWACSLIVPADVRDLDNLDGNVVNIYRAYARSDITLEGSSVRM